ncbi:MAG TPA: OmpH family outer membrane protein [Melioribacteraceae bacterium]|nr:OmpH family outer membrane protein [Melioribacteraceae bacterium]
MKIKIIILSLIFFVANLSYAQLKIGYVDSDTILKKMPDAIDAKTKIDATIAEWNEELRKIEQQLKDKKDDFEKRKLIMSEQTRTDLEKEIFALDKQIVEYKQKKFGVNGELFKKQEELMKPVQNRVFNAIQEVAKEKELDYIFDRSGDVIFLFAKPEYDFTNIVLEKLK